MTHVMLRQPGLMCTGAAGIALLLVACVFAGAAYGATTIEQQRAAFLKAYAAAQMGDASWRAWAEKLQGYPLFPYLQAAQFEHDIDALSAHDVAAYLKRYKGLIPALDLRRDFLHVLIQRKDWKTYLAFYRPGMGENLACNALRARLALGQSLNFKRDLATLWREPSLPKACNKVQVWAHKHGLLTPARLWQRIDSAAGERQADTIAWLARWLPQKDAIIAERYVEALRHPLRAIRAAGQWRDSGRNREAALLAITQLARESSARAVREWPRLARHFKFSKHARDRIVRTLALFRAYGFHDDALDLLAALPDSAETAATRAWRVRVAIAEKDWKAALGGLNMLDSEQAQSDSWRYLRARVLQLLGKSAKAHELLERLAQEANYWGFLAADRLGRPYVICPETVDHDPEQLEATILAYPGMARAFELFAVGMLSDARRAWARAMDDHDAQFRNKAAALAFRRGWYSRAIFAYSYGDLLQRYRQRFPLPHHDLVGDVAQDTGVEPAWIFATIRAESAWVTDAGSGAGALGLMQMMPATAKHVARRHGRSAEGFSYLPAVNIELGSFYLDNLAQRYGGRLWVASIAYNAGPGRVDDWLAARGELPADLFVATIPFTQTRNYAIRVLAYSVIYDWRLHGKPTRLAWRLRPATARGERERAPVVCPANVTAASAQTQKTTP